MFSTPKLVSCAVLALSFFTTHASPVDVPEESIPGADYLAYSHVPAGKVLQLLIKEYGAVPNKTDVQGNATIETYDIKQSIWISAAARVQLDARDTATAGALHRRDWDDYYCYWSGSWMLSSVLDPAVSYICGQFDYGSYQNVQTRTINFQPTVNAGTGFITFSHNAWTSFSGNDAYTCDALLTTLIWGPCKVSTASFSTLLLVDSLTYLQGGNPDTQGGVGTRWQSGTYFWAQWAADPSSYTTGN